MKNRILKIGLMCMTLGSVFTYGATEDIYLNFSESEEVDKNVMNYYKVRGFAGDNIVSKIDNLSADVDLYIRVGAKPTRNTYDCRPYYGGSRSEECAVTLTEDTTVYIGVNGYNAGSYNLIANLVSSQVKTITYNQEVFGISPKQRYRQYKIHANAGDRLKIRAYELDADGDLFVNLGSEASWDHFVEHSNNQNNSDEEITIDVENETDVYISLYASENCIHTVEHKIKVIKTNVGEDVTVLNSGETDSDYVALHRWKYYKINASSGDTVKSILNELNADADLYVKVGAKPTKGLYDCRPYNSGTRSEECIITLTNDTTVYIGVHGYRATNFNIKADISHVFDAYPEDTILRARETDFNVAKPTVDHPIIDSVFHTRIHKVDKVGMDFSPYPKVQAWNSNETLLRIHNRLYNAQTLKETSITKGKSNSSAYHTLCSRNSDYYRWSTIDPNTFYIINSSNEFIKARIRNNTVDCSNILDAFDDYELIHMGPGEGNIDENDKYVLFSAKKINDANIYLILYDIEAKRRVWTKVLENDQWQWMGDYWKPEKMDWISVSTSGRHIMLINNDNNNICNSYSSNINLTNKTELHYIYNGNSYPPCEHGDIGYDTDGNEVFVGFIAGTGAYSFNLDNPHESGKKILKHVYGHGHISCRNIKRPGWCYVATKGEKYQRVFALKLDGTDHETVENFSQTYLPTQVYSYGAVNSTGTQMIFNSYWSNIADGFDTFIAESEKL